MCTCPILFTPEIEVPKKSHFLKERDIKKSVSNTFSSEAQNCRYHKYTLGFSGRSFPKNDSPLVSSIKLSDKIHELKSTNLRLLFELLDGRYSLGVKVTKWRSIIIQQVVRAQIFLASFCHSKSSVQRTAFTFQKYSLSRNISRKNSHTIKNHCFFYLKNHDLTSWNQKNRPPSAFLKFTSILKTIL